MDSKVNATDYCAHEVLIKFFYKTKITIKTDT